VQIQWLGYSGTLGAPWIDYIVADAVLIGPQDERFYSEKVLRLPDTFLPSDDKQHAGDRGARAQHGLPEGAFVFGCFNQPYKITAPVFDTWMRLLAAVENSVLWLIDPKEEVRDVLRRRAAARGIAPERLVFASFIASTLDHRARIGHADLALDCFPYGSHTTASDALLAGVPMVALKGETFASRVSASILSAAGLQELIATELEGFYERAVGLARDAQALVAMRNRLGGLRFSPPFETRRFARNLEAAYSIAWNRHSSGLSPMSIDVAPGS
jgi:predicted O-linked N-acetylglucosamine transferase (SPINDLY family)